MPNAMDALRSALRALEQDKAQLDDQIAAIRTLLGQPAGRRAAVVSIIKKAPRRRMSAATRKRISERMKAAWAKRKAMAQAKAKGK